MAKPSSKAENSRDSSPQSFPEVPPPSYAQAVNTTYLVETVMQMQQSLGKLEAIVGHLKDASDKQSSKIDKISHIIYATQVVVALGVAVLGFFLNKIWDSLFLLLKTMP